MVSGLLKIKILVKDISELTTKFALERQRTDEVIAQKRLLCVGVLFITP